jgi:PAS domain S-box-containing protein
MIKLLKHKTLLIIFGLTSGWIIHAQEYTRTEIKSAYIFQIPQYIEWGDSFQDQQEFKIGILGTDIELQQTLTELAKKTKILGKAVHIKSYNSLKRLDTLNILCISDSWSDKMNNISQAASGKQTLLITDNYKDRTFIMINFVDKENAALEFEVNKANILLEELNILPKLLLIGGTEIDISELFDATLDSLRKAKNDIYLKQTELEKINIQMLKKESNLEELNRRILEQQKSFKEQKEEFSKTTSELSTMQNQYASIIDSMLSKENEFDQQQKSIQKQKRILDIQHIEIEEQNKEIIQQQIEISEHKGTLEEQKSKLDTQKTMLIIIAIMLIITLIMIIITTRQVRISKKTNLMLQNQNLQVEHQALEIKLQSKELAKQSEKLKEQSEELKQQNEILEQKRNHLRAILDNIPDIIYIKDSKSRFINANLRLVHHLGHKKIGEITGKTDFDFYEKDLASQFFNDEKEIFRTGNPIIKKAEPGVDNEGNMLHMETTKVPVKDSEGNIINIVGIGRDITKEKIAETKLKQQAQTLKASNALLEDRAKKIEKLNADLKDSNKQLEFVNKSLREQKEELQTTLDQLKITQNQLVQSEKMASLGVLTAGIAHEINNPVNFVYAGVNSLKKDFDDLTPVLNEIQNIATTTEALESIIKKIDNLREEYEFDLAFEAIPDTISDIRLGASRISEIVASLSKLSRIETKEWQISNIHEEIESVLIILKNKYKRNIEIIKDYGKDVPRIECNPGKINQVFMNIIGNAIDAIGEKPGKITISSSLNKEKIKISVLDTGKGIDEEIKSKIFDPFFTTKEVGKGIGLGLSITYSIIEEHNGKIYINNALEGGTEFVIEIPLIQKKKKEPAKTIKND